MSIIYEALKKVQGKSDAAAAVPAQPAGKALDANGVLKKSTAVRTIILLLVFLALGMFLIEIVINRWFASRAASYVPVASLASAPPLAAKPSVEPPASTPPPVAGPLVELPVIEPQPKLVLNGIVLSEDGNIALINDQILKAGDNIEGALVEEISENQVILSFETRRITLKAK